MVWFKKISVVLLCLVCLQTANAGWVRQNANTLAWLHDIYFFDETRGFIAGSGGTFLETENGGKSWTKRKKFTDDKILQIYFSDDYTGWLLCERDIFSRGAKSVSYLMKTTDGGENWEPVELKDAGSARITKVFFNQKERGFAIGESGAFFELRDEAFGKNRRRRFAICCSTARFSMPVAAQLSAAAAASILPRTPARAGFRQIFSAAARQN